MKFFEKWIRRQKPKEEKPSTGKNLLLQAYFSSLLCLVLCVSMFLGTSYAWFTSEVTNQATEIYTGSLRVGFDKKVVTDQKTEWADLSKAENKLFDNTIRWEPGYTAVETVRVVNKGDLTFKYVLNFTDGTLAESSTLQLKKVAEHFDVWVYDHEANKAEPDPAAYADEDSGWVLAGSLDQLLEGQDVLKGAMSAVRKDGQDASVINEGTTDGVATEKVFTIALHMKNTADTSVMGQQITLNAKLVAYQMSSEKDDLGENFDQMAATAEDLEEAFAKGGTVALARDIALTKGVTVPKGVKAVLDLNGHALTMEAEAAVNLITNQGELTITDSAENGRIGLTFKGEVNSAAVNTIRNEGVLIVSGGKITNEANNLTGQIGYAIDNYKGSSLTVNGGQIEASGSNYYDGIRLFCSDEEILVTVNGGKISSIWAQNPTANKATAVKGTVVINGGQIGATYFENYTTVRVATGVSANVQPYGAGKDNTSSVKEGSYIVYRFNHNS